MTNALAALGPLLGRLLMAALFLYSGYSKFTGLGRTAAAIAGRGLPYATTGAYVAAAAEVLGGVALVLGVKTRVVALLFVVYVGAVSYVFHWHPALRGDHAQLIQLLKNASIVGGLLVLGTHGPGRASVDRG